ncbi:hypothetical protein PAXRUDRAFT_168693, partial [Paxillus rubicundulus Ve08.2h10]
KLALKIIHSSTIILPVWKDILKELKKRDSCMPQDVATRWNSTFNMLEYATLTTNTGSITPSTQTYVLQSCLAGRRLDQNGRGT